MVRIYLLLLIGRGGGGEAGREGRTVIVCSTVHKFKVKYQALCLQSVYEAWECG